MKTSPIAQDAKRGFRWRPITAALLSLTLLSASMSAIAAAPAGQAPTPPPPKGAEAPEQVRIVPTAVGGGFGGKALVSHGLMVRCERAVRLGAGLGLAIPKFVAAPLLILLFAVTLQWLPAGGWDGTWRSMVLPVLALVGGGALITLAVRRWLPRGARPVFAANGAAADDLDEELAPRR